MAWGAGVGVGGGGGGGGGGGAAWQLTGKHYITIDKTLNCPIPKVWVS